MNYCFSFKERHTITSANKNVYVKPAIHPNRCINQHDFIYILEGSWQIGVESRIYDVKKDDVIILPANMYHYGTDYSAENTKTFFLHTNIAEGDGATTDESVFLSNTKCCIPTVINASRRPEVKDIFSNIIFSFKQDNPLKVSVLFDTLLLTLYEICEQKTKNNDTAYQIKNIIDENLHMVINTSNIAEKLHMSKKSVENKFKESFNTTIHQYALTQKMLLAKELLEFYPNMKIYEIAMNLGFYDEYHFSHSFKKYFGVSPSNYRISTNNKESITCK